MCAENGSTGACCGACAGAAAPLEMERMIRALDVGGLLTAAGEADAASRCQDCDDRDACRDFLDVAAIRGAAHAPAFCRNRDAFADLASEAPATL